jgi:hypothetical protein
MKNFKFLLVTLLAFSVIPAVSLGRSSARTLQAQSTALERGYRTGYSDGYNAGFKDITEKAPREYQNKDEYQRADRSYNDVWGPAEDYRDGYQQGFELGYAAGYDRQPFNSTIPAALGRRAPSDVPNGNATPQDTQQPVQSARTNQPDQQPVQDDNSPVPASGNANLGGGVSIPRNSVFLVELQTSLSTDATQRGDRFQARVIEPHGFDGAIVEGRVTAVKRPGKVKGVAQLQLSFDTIRFPDNRVSNFNADVIEVVQMNGDDAATVDPEGGVRGRDSTKDDVSKVGAATGIGAIIGAIAGGGKGAAIGAAIGGGIGAGGVLSSSGKDIRLDRGQQLRIRTATDTSIAAAR